MSQVQQIKEATNIVELIGERIELKRSGRNWRGLCPFHGEKSPSFFVSEEMQRYKCFGCGETGDVYNFLEKYEGMTFGESLQTLAQQAGITLQEYKSSPDDEKRQQHLEILNLAKEYYHYLLIEHQAGQKARDYLKNRGTNAESLKIFQIGYSLSAWDGLIKYLHHKKKYHLEDLVETGLVIKRKGRYYDRFRDRVMFPLKNHRGQVVGFSGRSLEADAKEAKYINSPETKLYHKAELLYGYSELLQFIRKKKAVIVTEGEFDVISSTQAHVDNIVAIKGSAFTLDHAKYIKRVAQKILFALDMDSAGVEATKRAIPIAQELDLELRVIKLGEFKAGAKKDPDDVAREDAKGWRELVKNSISVYQFLIEAAVAEFDSQTPEGKKYIIKELASVMSEMKHEVEKDYYLNSLAEILQVKKSIVVKDLEQEYLRQQGKLRKRPRKKDESENKKPLTRQQKLEKYIWFLLLRSQPEQIKKRAAQLLKLEFSFKKLALLTTKIHDFRPVYSLEKFSKFLPEDFQQLVFDLYLQPQYANLVEDLDIDKEWQQTYTDLKRMSLQEKIAQITQELDQLDAKVEKTKEEEEQQSKLLAEIVKLRAK